MHVIKYVNPIDLYVFKYICLHIFYLESSNQTIESFVSIIILIK